MLRHGTFLAKAHHFRTNYFKKTSEMTEKQRCVRDSLAGLLYEFSTAIEIYCTKIAQCVYADASGIRRLLTDGVNR